VIIDAHVHIVGDGSSGSGCWYRPKGLTRLMQPFMLKEFGLSRSALREGLDRAYAERLLDLVRTSSLDAAAIFAQDEVYADDGTPLRHRGTFYVPNDYIFALAAGHREFLPVVSIHPARPDAIDELARSVAQGAVALKLLPNCHNVDCRLPRYRKFWRALAESGLPLIAHTGGEGTVEEIRPELADPENLRAPLDEGATVIAAHCGAGLKIQGRDRFDVFAAMLREYPNLHGDISALSLIQNARRFRDCLRPGVVERIVHGSDVPVPVLALGALIWKLIPPRAYLRIRRIANPLERDYQLKRAIGFPDKVFTRFGSLSRALAAAA
jgi:hypothetical protein